MEENNMKITFLGTSHGIPSDIRFCTSTMIEVNGKLYFIDAGAPVIDLVLRNGKHPNDIKAVFCTHHHGDHTDGLLNLTDLCTWAFREASFDMYMTSMAVAEAFIKSVEAVEAPNGKFASDRLRFREVSEGKVYEDENVKVTYFPTRHCEPMPSYAILVEAEGKKLLFTGDMSHFLAKEDFPKYALENETDMLVCEMAHFGREHVEPYMERVKTKQYVFTHVNFWKDVDKFADIADMHNSGKFSYPITAVRDGDIIEL